MTDKIQFLDLLKRFYWDILDKNERKYYGYWLISQVPGRFGNLIRGRYLSRRFKSAGTNLQIYAGNRFRSMENLIVGDNVELGYDNFIQALGGVTLGDNVMLGPGAKIWSVNHNYKDKDTYIREQGQTKSPVIIGNDVWICSDVFIAPGVILPDGVVVSSGAVVGVKKFPPYSIIAGNPARVIGFREDTTSSQEAEGKSQDNNVDVKSETEV